jgi:hypothetical protein
MPGSERPPEGWPGWPEGKKFAVVLTHDVEGQSGLDKCRRLMELEMELGFRSSFNFIPEGSYRVLPALREELTRNGFEVGVHDLKHDGRLFRSATEFRTRAVRINEYLRDWNAVGFRSGFMLHNLDWLHDLDIEYDMSTFDTDPFEPQPEGRNTIFPFWVPRVPGAEDRGQKTEDGRRMTDDGGRRLARESFRGPPSRGLRDGYVELPYTLPQDSTLFLLLRERNADIWLRKIDWVAQHGGMALVDVHPDYLSFEGEVAPGGQYPSAYYKALLEYIKRQHEGAFWNETPSAVARFYSGAVNGLKATSEA